MALTFTSNPTSGQEVSSDGRTWKWTGAVWQLLPRTLTSADITDFSTAAAAAAPSTTNASLLISGTLPDARLSAEVTASLGKANSALQPSALTPYRTSAAQDVIDAGKMTTNFQPNPEYVADNAAHAQVSGFDGQSTAIFSRGNADYYQGIEYAISRNGQYNGGVTGSWALEYQPSDAAGGIVAISTTATTYPWQATWTNGVTVVKAALPRIVGTALATNASEGTSAYAARADHVHPFPTAAQVGAAPAGSYVTLDGTGKISSTLLPSYVDDVIEVANFAALPKFAYTISGSTAASVNGEYVITSTLYNGYPTYTAASLGNTLRRRSSSGVQPVSRWEIVSSGNVQRLLANYASNTPTDTSWPSSTAVVYSENAGQSGKIYVVLDTGKCYRWSGSSYIEISQSLELQDLQLPDSLASVNFNNRTLPKTGSLNGKNKYSFNDGWNFEVVWTGTNWRAAYTYPTDEEGDITVEFNSTGNTAYPWQATGWTNGGGVTRVGTYNAALSARPLAAEASSGIGAKAAREDHVHPLPTPAAIGAVSTTDPRLSDSRTPTNHKSTHATGGADALSPADIGALAATSAVDSPAAIVPSSALSGLWVNYDDLLLTPNAALTQYSASFGNLTSGGWDSKLVKNANNSWTWTHIEKSGPSTPITTRTVTSTSAGVYPYAVTWPTDNWFQSPNAITAGPMQKLAGVNLSSLNNSGATPGQVATWDGTAWVPQTSEKVIELTEAEYAALTPAQVDQTATYLVTGSTTQNSTSYQGKEFGGSKPVSFLSQPVIVGSATPISSTIQIGSVDFIQASPFDVNKFYFSQNIGGGALAAMWRGTLTKDSANRISGGTNSFGGQQALTYSTFNGSKGGGIYDADTVFIPDEKNSATDNYGRIIKVDLATSTTSEAWNFQTSTPAVSRADIASQLWYPQDCLVDRANNKLFVSSSGQTTDGSSVARFSIDPTTKALTPDGWVKAVTPNGSNTSFISRLTLLPDGYIFVANYNYSTSTLAFQSFDAYGSASGNASSVGISFAATNLCQGVAFKPDTNAPSGIGYILIALRTGPDAGKIYAFDYQGAGVFNTTATDSTNLTTIGKNAGLWTNAFNLEIGSVSVTADGSILCGIRGTSTTPTPRAVLAFNWIPYAKSGSLSTQNSENVNITGGSINGVRNLTPKVEYINSTRYWHKDELAKYIRVQAWAGGGGGGSGRKDSSATVVRSGGAGGGGGAYTDTFIDASLIASSITVTIGGGGNGGAAQTTNATNGNPGTAGGTTSFGSLARALGGALGGGGTAAAVTGGNGTLNGNAGGGSSATGAAGTAGGPNATTAPVGMGGVGGGGGAGLTAGTTTTTASAPSGSSTLTLTSVTGMAFGDSIAAATGIPAGTTITNINSVTKVVTLSAVTTATIASGATITSPGLVATSAGGAGGNSYYGSTITAGTAGTAGGVNGGNGNNTTNGTYQVGTGGGGGGSNTAGDGGAGGTGGFGSGGGGGGASQNGNSGAGGNGGNGFMIVTTFY